MTRNVGNFATLDPKYRVILCDLWGCIHNGVDAFPAAVNRLHQWRKEGRIVILLTNAPRPAAPVTHQLETLNIGQNCYDTVITSGAVGIEYAKNNYAQQKLYFLGSDKDRAAIKDSGLNLTTDDEFSAIICTGFHDAHRDDTAHYSRILSRLIEEKRPLLCFNPDQYVIRGGTAELCAGAIGNIYEELGGQVISFGKPHPQIYAHACTAANKLLGREAKLNEILAIGDGVATDLLGAHGQRIDFAFISSGIESRQIAALGKDAFFDKLNSLHDMAGYRPHITADYLA